MKLISTTFLVMVFTILAFIHFYWVLGGTWGGNRVIPTNMQGDKVLSFGTMSSLVVAIAFTAITLFYLSSAGQLKINFPQWVFTTGHWAIPIIFLLRAVGDFTYVGFFKKITTTKFAAMDTLLYSPLCLVIALVGFVLIKL